MKNNKIFKITNNIITPLFYSIAILLISNCTLVRTPTLPTSVPREIWITEWLEKPTCQPPCWENIIVGTSTITDTITFVNNMSGVDISGPSKDWSKTRIWIAWEYQNSQSVGDAETERNGMIISQLNLNIDRNQNVRLEEIIPTYGYPDYLELKRCHGFASDFTCLVDLIYEKGFAVELETSVKHNKFEISPNSEIFLIEFFTNGIHGYENEYGQSDLGTQETLIKWDGYKRYTYP